MKQHSERLQRILQEVNISYEKLIQLLHHGHSYEILACKYHFTKGAFLYLINNLQKAKGHKQQTQLLEHIVRYKDDLIALENLLEKVKVPEVDIRLS